MASPHGLRRWSAPLLVAVALSEVMATPAGKGELSRWTDKVTINTYPG